ncbi:hypothetical protein KPH14_003072 [Odynerus spinipes]|uniref:Uncharacterized protein n=1 Tax=Odynerus spinipes TaxID=1348599 RepID=A0AAD9RWR0_9HYME|nr:hypothetical protein KPH14_003072 [Odynerus spinipes]
MQQASVGGCEGDSDQRNRSPLARSPQVKCEPSSDNRTTITTTTTTTTTSSELLDNGRVKVKLEMPEPTEAYESKPEARLTDDYHHQHHQHHHQSRQGSLDYPFERKSNESFLGKLESSDFSAHCQAAYQRAESLHANSTFAFPRFYGPPTSAPPPLLPDAFANSRRTEEPKHEDHHDRERSSHDRHAAYRMAVSALANDGYLRDHHQHHHHHHPPPHPHPHHPSALSHHHHHQQQQQQQQQQRFDDYHRAKASAYPSLPYPTFRPSSVQQRASYGANHQNNSAYRNTGQYQSRQQRKWNNATASLRGMHPPMPVSSSSFIYPIFLEPNFHFLSLVGSHRCFPLRRLR